MATIDFLDRYLEPVTTVLTPELARKIIELQPEASVTARVQELGSKSNEGTLTGDERSEYESLANAGTLTSLVKAKARRFLAEQDS